MLKNLNWQAMADLTNLSQRAELEKRNKNKKPKKKQKTKTKSQK